MNRRGFLFSAAAAVVRRQPRVAAIVTEYRPLSHADVICGRILEGYAPNNVHVEPRTRIVSMYVDQLASQDMSRDLAARHGFRIYPGIEQALTCGTGRLAVDAVLLVGEHGNYPDNDRGQKLYPRFEFFEQIVRVFRAGRRAAPVFSDKHLSYSWPKAKQMYDWSRELRFPLMAGSSIPVTVRSPELELPLGCRLRHALAVGYGPLEAYGFHTLEVLQCMVERRAGGETGVAAVEMLEGDAAWRWRDSEAGRWSAPLLEAALSRAARHPRPGRPEPNVRRPALFLIEYRDGFHAAVWMLDGQVQDWTFAAKIAGRQEPVSTLFGPREPGRPLPHFDGLVRCIEEFFVTGRPVYPVERTLLTTGVLAFLFDSRQAKRRIETPALAIGYRAPRHAWFQRA